MALPPTVALWGPGDLPPVDVPLLLPPSPASLPLRAPTAAGPAVAPAPPPQQQQAAAGKKHVVDRFVSILLGVLGGLILLPLLTFGVVRAVQWAQGRRAPAARAAPSAAPLLGTVGA